MNVGPFMAQVLSLPFSIIYVLSIFSRRAGAIRRDGLPPR